MLFRICLVQNGTSYGKVQPLCPGMLKELGLLCVHSLP